jgi:hypothetical protein
MMKTVFKDVNVGFGHVDTNINQPGSAIYPVEQLYLQPITIPGQAGQATDQQTTMRASYKPRWAAAGRWEVSPGQLAFLMFPVAQLVPSFSAVNQVLVPLVGQQGGGVCGLGRGWFVCWPVPLGLRRQAAEGGDERAAAWLLQGP